MRALPGKTGKEKALVLIPFVFIVDRLLKISVLSYLKEGESLPVWPGVFHLTRVDNTGAAFGLWQGATGLLALFSALSAVLIVAYLCGAFGRRPSYPLAWTLVAGGALGNLYDRLRFGYVIDYLDWRVWPVFNFADICISLGIAWILFRHLYVSRPV